ncbi:aspartic proteinase nepenthesin-1 [Ziziphus jujuba]|nr:aspartic proteinase nepenthesin-1 [Ziziphus jujuba]
MAELTNKHFLATATLLIFLTTTVSHFHFTFSEDSKPTGFTLSLIPGDSPDSPLYQGNLTRHERMQRLINITQSKASLYRLMSSWPGNATTTPIGPENINLPMIRNNFYYAVKIGIGNPVYNAYLLLDTGSGLIWTQCEPCPTCYPMEYGIYDPRRSNTYSMLPSSHALCQSGYYKRVQNQCMYTMIYGAEAVAGGSTSTLPVPKTQGVASLETFTFANNEGGFSNIDGVIFGCSRYVQNFQDLMFNQKISGILGMNTAPDSLVTQLMNRIDRKFSYCIPSVLDQTTRPILVNFGTDVPRISTPLVNTLFVSPPRTQLFFLDLRDVSVGTHQIGFPKGTFTASPDGSKGVVIDSGAPFTVLAENINGVNAYLLVMSAFDAYYGQSQGLPRVKVDQFEYCYGLPNGFNDFLTLTFHFYPRADFVVNSRDVHYVNSGMRFFCVALMKNSGGLSLLGAYQQQNKHIVYNLDLNALQFATVTCPI